jgi:hypothetical protein
VVDDKDCIIQNVQWQHRLVSQQAIQVIALALSFTVHIERAAARTLSPLFRHRIALALR